MDITSNLIRPELEFMGFKRNVLFLQMGKEVSQYFKRLANYKHCRINDIISLKKKGNFIVVR